MAAKNSEIDLLVVGGGTAGIVGAKTAASLGAHTVLVERSRTGGDCLWTGCVPSKTLLAAAKRAKLERELTGQRPNFAAVRKRIFNAIDTIAPVDSPAALQGAGVEVRQGSVRFLSPGIAEIDGSPVAFRQALIATGSAPAVPPIDGLENARMVTSDTVWELEELPRRLAVIGGGPIACELGQAFARLGSEVTLLIRSQILPKEDRDAAAIVRRSLEADGVRVLENTSTDKVLTDDGVSRLQLGEGSEVEGSQVEADVVLVAAGRAPRSAGLNLAVLGVECDSKNSIVVDSKMQTSNPLIWAAGDVTNNPKFTHLAGVHASTAASNAVLGLSRSVSATVPRVTYTSPELAAIGVTSTDGNRHTASTIRHQDLDRAVTEDSTEGLTRLILGKRGRIAGGTIVGPRAGESLNELTLAVQNGLSTRDLSGLTHPYPTYNDGIWNAAIADARTSLKSPVVRAAVKLLVRVRRWRLSR